MAILTMIIPLAVLACVVIGALNGLKNGWAKQAIRIGFVFVALLISMFVTNLISDTLIASFENMSNESLAEIFDMIGYTISESEMAEITSNTSSISYLLAVPIAFVIAPIVFLIIYFIFHLITIIPFKIISKSIEVKKEKKGALSRLAGAGIGALQGLLIAVIVASPFSGISTTVNDAYAAIQESGMEDFEEVEALDSIPTNSTISLLGSIGGNLIYENLATVEVHGTDYNMKDDLAEPIVKLIASASELEDIEDFTKLTESDKESLDAIVEVFDDSDYISDLCANVLLIASDTLKDAVVVEDDDLAGEEEMTEAITQFIDSFFNVISDVATDSLNGETSLSDDLGTILSAYYILSDYDVLSTISDDPEYAVDALLSPVEEGSKVTVMRKVVDTLNTNKHTRPMVTVLSQISITALAGQFDMGGDVDITKVYNDVKTSVNAITQVDRAQGEEIYVAEVTDILSTALTQNNVDIEADIIDDMAQYIYDNPDTISVGDEDDDGELSDEEMNNLILSYYDVYLEYESTGDIPNDFPGDDLIPDDYID